MTKHIDTIIHMLTEYASVNTELSIIESDLANILHRRDVVVAKINNLRTKEADIIADVENELSVKLTATDLYAMVKKHITNEHI